MNKLFLALASFAFVIMALTSSTTTGPALAQHVHYTGPQCLSDCPTDYGPKKDTAAVRAAMLSEMHSGRLELMQISAVHVTGNYALLTVLPIPLAFLFKRGSDERWKTDDNATGGAELRHALPASVWNQLCAGKWPTYRSSQMLASGKLRYYEVTEAPCR